jgi:hypothetical protein
MSTDAIMTVANNSGSNLTCNVSYPTCMDENGNNKSHLEKFNAPIETGHSIAKVLIATNADGDCNQKQSSFTLNFVNDFQGLLGSIELNLGRGKFKTGVAANSTPHLIAAHISGKKTKHKIKIELLPMAQALLNSLLWANSKIIEAVPTPSFEEHVGKIKVKFEDGLLTGLQGLVCIAAKLEGTPETGVTATAELTAIKLSASGDVKISKIHKITGGVTLHYPIIRMTILLRMTSSGEWKVKVANVTLESVALSAKVFGVKIPSEALSALKDALETAVDGGPLHNFLLRKLNSALKKFLKKFNH